MSNVFDLIVDNLAEHGFAIDDQFLSQSEVNSINALREYETTNETFRKAGIGKNADLQINEAIRGDYIHWIDPASAPAAVAVYLQRMRELIQYLNQTLFLSLKDFEVHVTVYPVGTFYKRHLDQFKKDDHRKLSAICYLNDDWREEHGGELRMYVDNGVVDVLPTGGKLVIFRSDQIEHEVLPATRERRSLTGWILDQYAELRHL
jgi:SM-20-related protein